MVPEVKKKMSVNHVGTKLTMQLQDRLQPCVATVMRSGIMEDFISQSNANTFLSESTQFNF